MLVAVHDRQLSLDIRRMLQAKKDEDPRAFTRVGTNEWRNEHRPTVSRNASTSHDTGIMAHLFVQFSLLAGSHLAAFMESAV